MNEQQTGITTRPPRETNDRDSYTMREEYLLSHTFQPIGVKTFLRKDAQADGSVKCKICVEIDGAEWCHSVPCDDIVIKKPKTNAP